MQVRCGGWSHLEVGALPESRQARRLFLPFVTSDDHRTKLRPTENELVASYDLQQLGPILKGPPLPYGLDGDLLAVGRCGVSTCIHKGEGQGFGFGRPLKRPPQATVPSWPAT